MGADGNSASGADVSPLARFHGEFTTENRELVGGEDEMEKKIFTTESTEITESKHEKMNLLGEGVIVKMGCVWKFRTANGRVGIF